MIIYGTGSNRVAEGKIKADCMYCNTPDTTIMHIRHRYGHAFFIPLFPAGKVAATECSHCKHVFKKKDFNDRYKQEYEKLKGVSRAPWWMYIGLVLIAFIIAAGIYQFNKEKELTAEMVNNPQPGDLFEVRMAYKEYGLIKIVEAVGDSIYFLQNSYASDRSGSISDLKVKPYDSLVYIMHRTELKDLLENDDITNIERPK